MSSETLSLTPQLYDYLLKVSLREPEVMRLLREETASLSTARMQISPEQGQFMQLLIQLLGAKKALEIGTYTGYSALAVALALPADGRLIACDVSTEWTDIGKRFWRQAGVADKIDLRIAPALDTLNSLLAANDMFDFIFIDADKANYSNYYELGVKLLRQGGLLVVDNVLWGGDVADETIHNTSTESIRALNDTIYRDSRVFISMLPVGDGLTLVRKK